MEPGPSYANRFIDSISGRGITLCIEKAQPDSGVSREEINYVNAHATCTQSHELKEFKGVRSYCSLFWQEPLGILLDVNVTTECLDSKGKK